VADARFAKPLDTALIDRLLAEHGALVTLEQGAEGGFGAQVLHYLARTGGLERGRLIRTLTLPDRFIDQASPAEMYAEAGLRATDIAETVRKLAAKLGQGVVPLAKPRLI
jgi:1-deoxy-D-xylulose-5-phosphate synthase